MSASPDEMTRFGTMSARAAVAADDTFLARLYASTRTDLAQLPLPAEMVAAIVRHQQHMQAASYARDFPEARYYVLEHEGAPVGRIVLDSRAAETRVVDLAIAPEARRRGHAREVLRALQVRAQGEGRALALRVRRDNPEARALYLGLGFAEVSADEVALQMRWD